MVREPARQDLEALLPRAAPALWRRRASVCCFCCLLTIALVVWAAHAALDDALLLVCLGLRVESVRVDSLCDNPMRIRAVVETSSASRLRVSFSDLRLGVALGSASRAGLTVRVVGTHAISLGERVHDLEVLVSLNEEAQVEGMLQVLVDSVLCAAIPDSPERAANCSSELAAMAESADIRIAVGVGARVPLLGPVALPVGVRVDRSLKLDAQARLKMHDAVASLRRRARCAGGGETLQVRALEGFSIGDVVFEGFKVPELSAERTRADVSVALRVNGSIHVRVPPLALRVCARDDDGDDDGDDDDGALSTLRSMPSFNRALANTSAPTSGCIGTLSTQPFTLGNGEPTIIGASGVVTYGYGAGDGDGPSARERERARSHAAARPAERAHRRGGAADAASAELSDMLSPLHFAELVSRGRSVRVRGASDAEALEAARRLGDESTDDAAHEAARGALRSVQGREDAPVAGSRCLLQRVLQAVSLEIPLRRLLPPAVHAIVKDAAAAGSCLIGVSMAYGINRTEQSAVDAQLDSGLIMQDCVLFLSHVVEDSNAMNAGAGGAAAGVPQTQEDEMRAALGDAAERLARGAVRFDEVPPRAPDEGAGGACRVAHGVTHAPGTWRPRRVPSLVACELACLAEPGCAAVDYEGDSVPDGAGKCSLWTRAPLSVGPARALGRCLRLVRAAERGANGARVSDGAEGANGADGGADGANGADSPAAAPYWRVQMLEQLSMVTCHARCAHAAGCVTAEYWAASPVPLNCALWFAGGEQPRAMLPAPPPLLAPRAPPLLPPSAPPAPPPAPPAPPPPPPPRCEDGVHDLALFRPVRASSSQFSTSAAAAHVVDADGDSQWITGSVSAADLTIEFESWSLVRRVVVRWAEVGGASWVDSGEVCYSVELGEPGAHTVVATVRSTGSGVDTTVLPPDAAGRSMRLAFSRPSRTGFAIWAVEALGCAYPGAHAPHAPRARAALRPAHTSPPPAQPPVPSSAPPALDATAPSAPTAERAPPGAPVDAAECYTRKDLADYRGRVNRTVGGLACQSWSSQQPHEHNFTPARYPGGGLGDHNSCRAVGSAWAWCFTLVERPSWQYCRVGPRQQRCPPVRR
ncbi:hypothetical protein KFE25_013692 [Diacronema lutheri]|uniref:Kringle domain-containing protein n=1 Tax=Diacronema lutheri TaxID=2081491 RepID=A0A8J6CDI1_DIALT|nr:hypothetical protein KFE25_013692 [Diacronema lutheri]